MEEQREAQEFTCPYCGSHKFGTHTPLNQDPATSGIGTCHGYVQSKLGQIPCSFTWARIDDAQYFKGTGRFVPTLGVAQAVPRK